MINTGAITFGSYNWRVLDIKAGKALIITEDIIELRWYQTAFADITWANCEMRTYLNSEFYNEFSEDEKAKIIEVTNRNSDNPWFKTKGGIDTEDSIFLLSLEEVCTYFGDSSTKLRNKGMEK